MSAAIPTRRREVPADRSATRLHVAGSARRLSPVLAIAAMLLAAGAIAAEQRTLRLDPAETRIDFFLGTPLHDVEGSFALKSGEVSFDPASGAARGEIVVDLTGAKTGNGSRDKTMHREVLETPRFPLAVLRVERVEGRLPAAGRAEVKLAGVLDFHGAPHAIVLPATVEVSGRRLSARAELTIPFLDWGLHDPSFFMLKVQRQVKVSIATAGELSGGD